MMTFFLTNLKFPKKGQQMTCLPGSLHGYDFLHLDLSCRLYTLCIYCYVPLPLTHPYSPCISSNTLIHPLHTNNVPLDASYMHVPDPMCLYTPIMHPVMHHFLALKLVDASHYSQSYYGHVTV